ncbi:MAG: hypothetical protein ACK42D_01820 [Candidatus Paceibacteria bacterium]
MGKSSSRNNLQKIHTYAQDIEAVRGVTNSSDDLPTQTPPPKHIVTPATKVAQPPIVTETEKTPKNTELLIPQKPKLPAIRTMVSDSKKITGLADAPAPSKTPPKAETKKLEVTPPEIVQNKKEEKTYIKAPTIHIPTPNKVKSDDNTPILKTSLATKPAPEIEQAKPEPVPLLANKVPTKKTPAPEKITTKKQTRDSSYSATVITDTKYKRFSLWKEFKNRINDLIKSKTTKKKVNYTTPTAPLRKGVIQSATTNTARKTIADYSSLKDRVKARVPEETEIANNNETAENEELNKTRSELLTTIQKEVSEIDNELPDYLSPIHHTALNHATATFNKKIEEVIPEQKTDNSLSWEHYTDDDIDASAEVSNPTQETVPRVTLPQAVEDNLDQTNSPDFHPITETPTAENLPALTNRILPTIPTAKNEIPDIDMTVRAKAVQADSESELISDLENPPTQSDGESDEFYTPIETVEENTEPTEENIIAEAEPASYPQTTETYTEENTIDSEPYFTQPKIEPIFPFGQQTNLEDVPYQENSPITSLSPAPTNARPIQLDQEPSSTTVTPKAYPQPTQSSPRRKNWIANFITERTHTFILGGLVLSSIVIIGGIGITSLVSKFNGTTNTESSHRYFNSSALYPVTVSPLSPLIITEQISRHNNAIGVSEIILQSADSVTVSPTILSQLLKLPLEPSFNASLSDIRFGWYREEPFIVIQYSGDTIAKGALLQWERTMYTDLLPLFNKTPVSSSLTTVFKDTTINNIDIRALYLSTGEEVLLYGIVAPGHLIITTNEMSFLNLSNNFNAR